MTRLEKIFEEEEAKDPKRLWLWYSVWCRVDLNNTLPMTIEFRQFMLNNEKNSHFTAVAEQKIFHLWHQENARPAEDQTLTALRIYHERLGKLLATLDEGN